MTVPMIKVFSIKNKAVDIKRNIPTNIIEVLFKLSLDISFEWNIFSNEFWIKKEATNNEGNQIKVVLKILLGFIFLDLYLK